MRLVPVRMALENEDFEAALRTAGDTHVFLTEKALPSCPINPNEFRYLCDFMISAYPPQDTFSPGNVLTFLEIEGPVDLSNLKSIRGRIAAQEADFLLLKWKVVGGYAPQFAQRVEMLAPTWLALSAECKESRPPVMGNAELRATTWLKERLKQFAATGNPDPKFLPEADGAAMAIPGPLVAASPAAAPQAAAAAGAAMPQMPMAQSQVGASPYGMPQMPMMGAPGMSPMQMAQSQVGASPYGMPQMPMMGAPGMPQMPMAQSQVGASPYGMPQMPMAQSQVGAPGMPPMPMMGPGAPAAAPMLPHYGPPPPPDFMSPIPPPEQGQAGAAASVMGPNHKKLFDFLGVDTFPAARTAVTTLMENAEPRSPLQRAYTFLALALLNKPNYEQELAKVMELKHPPKAAGEAAVKAPDPAKASSSPEDYKGLAAKYLGEAEKAAPGSSHKTNLIRLSGAYLKAFSNPDPETLKTIGALKRKLDLP